MHTQDEAHTGGRHTSGELHEAGHRDVTRLAAQAHHAHNGNGGPGRFVEDSPSKGRLGKTHRCGRSEVHFLSCCLATNLRDVDAVGDSASHLPSCNAPRNKGAVHTSAVACPSRSCCQAASRISIPLLTLHLRFRLTCRVDNSTARASAALEGGKGTYEDVIAYAERLFAKIRTAVACQNAPATLKNAFLDPMADQLATDVSIELFAKSDAEFMTMFTAAGAMAALQAKRDSLARRVEGLIKCKNEFQELAKCL